MSREQTTMRCLDCHMQHQSKGSKLPCPHCGSPNCVPLSECPKCGNCGLSGHDLGQCPACGWDTVLDDPGGKKCLQGNLSEAKKFFPAAGSMSASQAFVLDTFDGKFSGDHSLATRADQKNPDFALRSQRGALSRFVISETSAAAFRRAAAAARNPEVDRLARSPYYQCWWPTPYGKHQSK
jgi:hypothetical protein